MATPFSENLRLVLKMLSMSAAALASELETDKSVVSRWLNGSIRPSAHNLSCLSSLVSARIEGFTALDWEPDPRRLAGLFRADPNAIASMRTGNTGLPVAIWDQMVATTKVRDHAIEGIFRTTRPHPPDAIGLLHLTMGSAENVVQGWVFPLQGLIYCVATEVKNGTMLFGIFNDAGASRLDVFDGLTLIPGVDTGRSPTATAMRTRR